MAYVRKFLNFNPSALHITLKNWKRTPRNTKHIQDFPCSLKMLFVDN